MDGNRRWAKEQGLPSQGGHLAGRDVFERSVEWARSRGVRHVVYYAFSTENWKRSETEVAYLMELFRELLREVERRLDDNEATENETAPLNVRCIGRRSDLPADIQEQIKRVEAKNARYPKPTTTVWVALSYGGRAEIIEAVNRAVQLGEAVTEATFEELLWSAELPDPDMIVRTSGEQRLSNFLTWRSVYSELYFPAKHWPALTEADFDDILEEYARRERRTGA
jgi:undecaprenyl diphosphate synthase